MPRDKQLFKRARKSQAKARVAIIGLSGSGKTILALETARKLGQRVAFIDTENGSASKYADRFEFDVLNLEDFHPYAFIEAIQAASGEGYDVIIIDSLSAAWDQTKQLVDEEVVRSKSGNSFQAWGRVGTPLWNRLLQAIVQCPAHVIATMRSKTEYVVEQTDKGKATPRKVGMAPQVRDGAEYEFDVVLELDSDHRCWATKTRCFDLDGKMWQKDDGKIGEIIRNWLSDGDEPAAAVAAAAAAAVETPVKAASELKPEPVADSGKPAKGQQLENLAMLWKQLGYGHEEMSKLFEWLGADALAGTENWDDLTMDQAARAIGLLTKKLSEKEVPQ